MYLFFDVNATGMPKSWNRPVSDTFNWPRMVQIAWLTFDENKKLTGINNYIIRPEGFEIPPESERIHKISTERAREEGTPLEEVLEKFAGDIAKSQYVVAHNLNLDEKVVGAEFIRKNIPHQLFNTERFCLMQESTYFCKLPGRGGKYKWPSIGEIYFKIYGKKLLQSYNAEVDAKVCAASFFRLVSMDVIDVF